MERYVVTEVEGFRINERGESGQRVPGLSVHVLDTAYCYRIVSSFRSEDRVGIVGRGYGNLGGTRILGRAGAREKGASLAAELNRES